MRHVGPPCRFEAAVRRALGGGSRRFARSLIADGVATLNGRSARKGALVHAGDEIEVTITPTLVADDGIPVTVLDEQSTLVALDKPAPMPTLPLDPREEGTVANFVLARWPECRAVGGDLTNGVLHRLDGGTSGVVLVARDAALWTTLRAAFAGGRIEKHYRALVSGHPKPGSITAALAHDPSDRRRMKVARGGDRAWHAVTEVVSVTRRGLFALVDVSIRTGVTHQIRAHLASMGTPVVGDVLYGGPADAAFVDRHALHASRIVVPPVGIHPGGAWSAPYPAALAD